MRAALRQYLTILRCPDDGYSLLGKNGSLKCPKCGRLFPIFSDSVIELLPNIPYPLKAEKGVKEQYLKNYHQLLQEKFRWKPSARGWGDFSIMPKGYRAFVKNERKMIEAHLGKSLQGLICDVSAGAGNYSLYYTKAAELVVHCDLDVGSINFAYKKSRQHSSKRILFVRCDYLQLPFHSNVFDAIICTDTLERGLYHEIRLMMEIIRCLKLHGKFAVDFHNKFRIPLAPSRKSSEAINYSPNEIQDMFSQFNLKCYDIKPIGYCPNFVPFEKAYTYLDKIFQIFMVPSSRWIVFGEKDGKN